MNYHDCSTNRLVILSEARPELARGARVEGPLHRTSDKLAQRRFNHEFGVPHVSCFSKRGNTSYAAFRSRCLVRAAFCAALLRPVAPFVRTAFIAARRRSAGPRVRAELLACRASDSFDAAFRGSRFNARATARERRADGLRRRELCPLR